MDKGGLKNWQPKLKLNDYKEKVDYSVKRNRGNAEAFRSNLMSTLNKTPTYDLNASKDSKSSMSSNCFNHYSSLRNFRTLSGMGDLKYSASSIYSPQQPLSPLYGNDYKYTLTKSSSLCRKESPINKHFKPEIPTKHLSDLITIGTLSKAIGIVSKGGLENVSLSYIRQLQNFCELIIKNLNN